MILGRTQTGSGSDFGSTSISRGVLGKMGLLSPASQLLLQHVGVGWRMRMNKKVSGEAVDPSPRTTLGKRLQGTDAKI